MSAKIEVCGPVVGPVLTNSIFTWSVGMACPACEHGEVRMSVENALEVRGVRCTSCDATYTLRCDPTPGTIGCNKEPLMASKTQIVKQLVEERVPYDEPLFLLRGQDVLAADIVDLWCDKAEKAGVPKAKVDEARLCVQAMRTWPHRKRPD